MVKEKKEFSCEIQEGFDFIIEEGANTSTNLRKVSWNGREPKLDLRKWSYSDGQEKALRGATLTEDGGNELACVLVECGYGDTNRLLASLSKRKDFNGIANISNNTEDEDDTEEEYYDPKMLIG